MIKKIHFKSNSGVTIQQTEKELDYNIDLTSVINQLEYRKGVYLCSGYEDVDRYSRWDIIVIDPPIELSSVNNHFKFEALNEKGKQINEMLFPVLKLCNAIEEILIKDGHIEGNVKISEEIFSEEERSRQPSIFSVIRALMDEFSAIKECELGLIGAFGYDLIFQFDKIKFRLERLGRQKDMRLFFIDEIYKIDRKKETIKYYYYDFSREKIDTSSFTKEPLKDFQLPSIDENEDKIISDHKDGEYQSNVEIVRRGMKLGNYFEVVLSQKFQKRYKGGSVSLFKKIKEINPSPYEFLIQFLDEQLIGASPEMFIRVNGKEVETCPISGTIRRSGSVLEDADRLLELLNSEKDKAELTMCTDVDRNDKSRVCVPGSVKVLGRRIIEKYAGLFHTVDYVVGTLKEGFDSIDAFLSHMWAVTLTGAPKLAAVQEIENLEKSARRWYGGAVGVINFNGNINTGITIRTTHVEDQTAYYRAGATLNYYSEAEAEYQETLTKATSFFRILQKTSKVAEHPTQVFKNRKKVLFIDNEDSFVHTLSNYVRQAGGDVVTYRYNFSYDTISRIKPDLIFISPGPGRPADYKVPQLVLECVRRNIPVFGVCLGLQGIVEAFGGKLNILDTPMHGKSSMVSLKNQTALFKGLPSEVEVGRYHSLYADLDALPACLEITAQTFDGIIMGIKHKEKPVEAIQFHPESIMTAKGDYGLMIIQNLINRL